MSIPPLVCSTPPPPDQCEDDKDPDDFDMRYNLSQDDDNDDHYDYGNFSTYNHFQSSKSEANVPVINNVVENENIDDSLEINKDNTEIDLGTNIDSESNLRFDEEINIEDLDLIVNEEAIEHPVNMRKGSSEGSKLEGQGTDSLQEVQVQIKLKDNTDDKRLLQTDIENPSIDLVNKPSEIVDEVKEPSQIVDEVKEPSQIVDAVKEPYQIVDEVKEPSQIADEVKETSQIVDEIKNNVDNLQQTTLAEPRPSIVENFKTIQEPEKHYNMVKEVVNKDDQFEDFDDFQFASTADKSATSFDNCDNPWDNNDITNDEFIGFKANFDENASNFSVIPEHSIDVSKVDDKNEKNTEADDDFGDFDDFKSTTVNNLPSKISEECTEEQYMPINLQSTDNEAQLIETINKVIYSVFLEDIPEPEEEFQGKLESVLGETWGHLLEIDVRQPYMVNWNNSLGQKTLLRALCIDSRNILFGPKWSYNMPKYAANLSAAPLQPQKQAAAPSVTQVEAMNPEKMVSKTDTWSDPFTSGGQDSCNPDNGINNQVIETGPTDLDVFEASTSSKPDILFSSTLSVQPLRQINLPDTHIFTPTDSETPRSTTIHYDSSPTVHVPPTDVETSKCKPNFKSVPEAPQTILKPEDDDYWEFQDFKGTSHTLTSSAINENNDISKTDTSLTYATQLLQPIKMEPIIPTLNWPDPGEVKETFDDFSDFVSNSTLDDPQHPLPGPSNTTLPTQRVVDDDFDTFQSAMPSKRSLDFSLTSIHNTSSTADSKPDITAPKTLPSTLPDFQYAFPKINTVKSENISLENKIRLKDTNIQSPSFPNNLEGHKTPEMKMKNSPIQTKNTAMPSPNLLQPTPAISSTILQNQQKSAQILQPLSLESYSQINWPNPGIDLQDLSRFNPVETLHSLKTDLSANNQNKVASPAHSQKNAANNQLAEDDIWGEFVSSKPKPQPQPTLPKKQTTFADDDEWTDFVSSPSVKPQNGLNTISLNVHSNFNIQKSNSSKYSVKNNQLPLDIPTLNYITPKASSQKIYNDRHFQNL